MPDIAASVQPVDSRLGRIAGQILLLAAAIVGLYWAKTHSYLLAHSLVEVFSVVIGCSIFVLAWHSRRFHNQNHWLLLLGVGFLALATLDVAHMLSYKGMRVVGDNADTPTQLWIASRLLQSASLLLAPLLLGRRVNPWLLLSGFVLVTAILLASILWWGIFPTCYVETADGHGYLTPFKKGSEYVAMIVLLAAMGLLTARQQDMDGGPLALLLGAMAFAILEGVAFTRYRDVDAWWNWTGHILKLLSYWLVYRAIFVSGLERPFGLLFRNLKRREGQLEAAKATAESASQAKDQFLAVLSHELRTPLTPVLTSVQMLEGRDDLPTDVSDALTMIRRNVELEARLIDDLLDLTRISRGKLQLQLRSVDVHAKLLHVLSICADEARAKGLTVLPELQAARYHVRGDPARLQQVFWNLLKNAVKFTPPGGQVWVRSRNRGPAQLLIEVRDTGVGIDPAVLPRLFNAFEQGKEEVTRLFGGLGLGLAIARALVDQHGGSIEALSDGPGLGSTFVVRLPVAAVIEMEPPSPARESGRHSPSRILLVEDHPDTARVMARLLTNTGYYVRVADSVAGGLKAASAESFDLLISDIGLPDGSGLDLMRQIRQRSSITGIALSGYGMEEDVRKSREAGFAEHLTKPINIEQLKATVSRMGIASSIAPQTDASGR